MLPRSICSAAIALIALLAGPASAEEPGEERPLCTEDAMIVFDASGSMAGNMVQGLFSAVSEVVVQNHPLPVIPVGIGDCFGETGTYTELLTSYGLTEQDIVKAAQIILEG